MSVSAHTAFLMVTGIEAQRPWMHTCVWSRKSQTLRCSENHNRVHHGCGSLRKMSKVKNHPWETSNGCSEEFLTAFILFFTLLQISLLFIRTCVFSELRTHKSHNSVSQGFPYLDACKTSFYVEWKHFVFFHFTNEKRKCKQKTSLLIRLNRHFLELFQPKGCFNSNLFGIGSYSKLLVAVNLKLVIRRGNVETIFLFCFLLPCHIF